MLCVEKGRQIIKGATAGAIEDMYQRTKYARPTRFCEDLQIFSPKSSTVKSFESRTDQCAERFMFRYTYFTSCDTPAPVAVHELAEVSTSFLNKPRMVILYKLGFATVILVFRFLRFLPQN